jgi:hypothetical protein
MPAPSQEQFEAAPLYRFRRPVEEPAPRDWSQAEIVLEGLNLVRTDGEDEALEYRLENVLVAVGGRHEHEGEQGFRIQYLSNDEQFQIFAGNREEAMGRFGRMIERSIDNRDEVLFARLRENDVEVDEIVEHHAQTEDDRDDPDFEADAAEGGGEIDAYGPAYFDPVRVVRDGVRMWAQGEEASRLWFEARHEMVRVGEDGQVLCDVGSPMLQQLQQIGRGNENGARHIADIRAGIGAADRIAPTNTRYDVHFFDLHDSGVVDTVVPQERLEAYGGPGIAYAYGDESDADLPVPVDPSIVPHDRSFERHIGQIMREEAGMYLHFEEIRTGYPYRNPTIRGVMREQMSPYLGGFPMEHVLRSQAPRDPEGHAAFLAFWNEGEIVMEVPVQTHPSQPGYRTEPGHVFRRDGWDALVFSDAMGTYAYAFPSPPDVVAKPEEPEAYVPRM